MRYDEADQIIIDVLNAEPTAPHAQGDPEGTALVITFSRAYRLLNRAHDRARYAETDAGNRHLLDHTTAMARSATKLLQAAHQLVADHLGRHPHHDTSAIITELRLRIGVVESNIAYIYDRQPA